MRTTLLIMAAGIGSRFGGGIKQLEPVGLNDEIIMDYSVHDAIAAGFDKIIFVIRRDIEQDFRIRIGDRIQQVCHRLGVEVGYAFQDIQAIPAGFSVPEGRVKPWGTGQAVLAAKGLLHEPFMVINADDYYGKSAYSMLRSWLLQEHGDNAFAMVGFSLKNTLSENGGVTRGLCRVDRNHSHVVDVVETRNIIKTPLGAQAEGRELDLDTPVSMNMWGFPAKPGCDPHFLEILEKNFQVFFRDEVSVNPLKSEYLLPTLIGGMLRRKECTLKMLPSADKWFGVTYKEDKLSVTESFRQLIDAGVYQKDLYSDL